MFCIRVDDIWLLLVFFGPNSREFLHCMCAPCYYDVFVSKINFTIVLA